MLRLVGIGLLVGALVLVCGPAAREPLTKEEYIDAVRAAANDVDDRRLFDDVVNYDYYPCGRICSPDETTLTGGDWLRAERRLREAVEALPRRFRPLRPPSDIARLHVAWMTGLRGCAAALRDLESRQKSLASGDFELVGGERIGPSGAFEIVVAERMRTACSDRFEEIIQAFEERGYVFAPTS